MEQLIALAAFTIMATGLCVFILGLVAFTRCFGSSPPTPPEAPDQQNKK